MLKQRIDFTQTLVCVRYGRMSNEDQNKRSPDQQFDTIDDVVRRRQLTWAILQDFRDEGFKGALLKRRPQFWKMITAIRSGELNVDAILVDTLERFGRADEIASIRLELQNRYGVVVLTADTNFADPTTAEGRALSFVEQIRATAGNEVKAHDVWRGKRDAARLGKWPGGPAPFGKRLARQVTTDARGNEVVTTELVRDSATEPIVLRALRLGLDEKWGGPRIARVLNEDPSIPAELKPFRGDTVGYWLDNPIYAGVYRWALKCTGTRNDMRIQQRNPDGPDLIEGYCAPLITKDEWQKLQEIRRGRGAILKAQRQHFKNGAAPAAKHITALGAGMTVRSLLTGLVLCAQCNSRMIICSSAGESKNGTRYAYYRCPLHVASGDIVCGNRHYVREDRLCQAVLSRVRGRLLPPPALYDGKILDVPEWLPQLEQEFRLEFERLLAQNPDHSAALEREAEDLKDRLTGLYESLAKRGLSAELREGLEAQSEAALKRSAAIKREIEKLGARSRQMSSVLDSAAVVSRLTRLDAALAGGNLTDGNAQLSLHIAGIYCNSKGNVQMRTYRLGVFEGAAELLSVDPKLKVEAPDSKDVLDQQFDPCSAGGPSPAPHRVTPRRRAKLRVSAADFDFDASNPELGNGDRYQNLDAKWFHVEPIEIGRKETWAELNANAVWALRLQNPTWSVNRLAREFPQVSRPTVAHALRIAKERAAGRRDAE